jgi:LacI family transcriptional regulator
VPSDPKDVEGHDSDVRARGRPRVTSVDIARAAGVSQPTVSRALRGDPRVAEVTAARVRSAATRLGYVRHDAARSLVTRRTDTVGLLASDLNNPFYPQLVQALHAELEGAGLRSLLLSEREHGAERVAELIRGGIVDGAIVATARLDDATKEALERETAVVLVVREIAGLDRDTVVAANKVGAELAARALVELGHRRIAMVNGPADTSTAAQREKGFRSALGAAGIEPDEGLIRRGEFSHEAGRCSGADLLADDRPPTAIFCANDVIALGVLDAAAAAGLWVPEGLSVIGFDDIPQAGWETVSLATVGQPLEEMAAKAVEMFAERASGHEGHGRRVVFPTSLVRRRTLGPPPDGTT